MNQQVTYRISRWPAQSPPKSALRQRLARLGDVAVNIHHLALPALGFILLITYSMRFWPLVLEPLQ